MKRKLIDLFGKYPIYFLVGGFVTAVTIILFDIIGRLLQRSAKELMISIVAVYTVGIVLSYILQSRFTFQTQKTQTRSFKYKFLSYVAVQLAGMGVTIALILPIRYLLFALPTLPVSRDTIAFAIASLIASVVTYTVSKMHIFKEVKDPKTKKTRFNQK
ncbi:MAG: GtrA family protein [Pseudanabaena sp. SU_2_4]|nr:GtrA family protein [Pseudanabaena sp. SU_2_4]